MRRLHELASTLRKRPTERGLGAGWYPRAINAAYCCIMLPGLEKIFSVAALTLGGIADGTNVVVPRPQVCSAVPQQC